MCRLHCAHRCGTRTAYDHELILLRNFIIIIIIVVTVVINDFLGSPELISEKGPEIIYTTSYQSKNMRFGSREQ